MRVQGSEDVNDGQSALWSVSSNHSGPGVFMKQQGLRYFVFLEKKTGAFGERPSIFL